MNTLKGINTPGEWASLNGKIYLYPKSGTSDIYVPQLTELIRIDDGTVDGNANVTSPVTDITFDGLTFGSRRAGCAVADSERLEHYGPQFHVYQKRRGRHSR